MTSREKRTRDSKPRQVRRDERIQIIYEVAATETHYTLEYENNEQW